MHSLPGRHWKWRMHGAAATWTPLMHSSPVPDVVVTTDMCDVAQLRGLMPRAWAKVKVVCMFHENQLTFPWSPDDPDASNGRDNTYAYINISSCLAADEVWFNSFHHQHLFLEAVDPWMQRMPKPHLKQVREKIKSKSVVMPLGMDFSHWTSPNDLCRDFSHVEPPMVLGQRHRRLDEVHPRGLGTRLGRSIRGARSCFWKAARGVGIDAGPVGIQMRALGIPRKPTGLRSMVVESPHRSDSPASRILWTVCA